LGFEKVENKYLRFRITRRAEKTKRRRSQFSEIFGKTDEVGEWLREVPPFECELRGHEIRAKFG